MRGPVWSTMPRSSRPAMPRCTRRRRRTAPARPRTAPSWSARFVLQRHRPAAGARLRRPAVGRGHRRRRADRRPVGLCAQARPGPRRPRDRRARPRRPGRQRPAGGARSTARDERRRPSVPVYVELPATPRRRRLARGRRRGRRGRAAAEVPHRRARRRGVPHRRGRWRAGSTRRSTARRRSSARPGCTTPSGTPARTGSSTTASSTCCSRPGRPSTAPRSTRSVAMLEQRDARRAGRDCQRRTWPAPAAGSRRSGPARSPSRSTDLRDAGTGRSDDGFGLDHLPYGVFSVAGGPRRVGVRYDDGEGAWVVDLHARDRAAGVRRRRRSTPFMALGPEVWRQTRERGAGPDRGRLRAAARSRR